MLYLGCLTVPGFHSLRAGPPRDWGLGRMRGSHSISRPAPVPRRACSQATVSWKNRIKDQGSRITGSLHDHTIKVKKKQRLSFNSDFIFCYAISVTGNSCGSQKNVIYMFTGKGNVVIEIIPDFLSTAAFANHDFFCVRFPC